MLLNSWSITLLVISAASFFLAGGAARTAIRILRFWDADADTARQIQLENETWLSALLMEYGMVLQLVGLLLLVLAADSYSEILIGAMCATGAFLANGYGISLLLVKILGVFLYGFWIVLHRLDISSEYLPLTRFKFLYLLMLTPLLLFDMILLVLYLVQLEPDIITSCCGVVFGNATGEETNLIGPMPVGLVMSVFFSMAGVLSVVCFLLLKKIDKGAFHGERIIGIVFSLSWMFFFCLALLVITAVISSYIYAMPFHRCPFDILKKEYCFVGYPIYITLFAATFFGMSAGVTSLFTTIASLEGAVRIFRKTSLRLSLLLLPLFLVIISWFPAVYFLGGDR
ncbi:MAG: hypothetical protein GY799_02845 [Desulfobulbaceae bacterium]|nr:hypothetical protein [Desulfobulbaceae bacterium]